MLSTDICILEENVIMSCDYFLISVSIPAVFDLWLLGDSFLNDAFNEYLAWLAQTEKAGKDSRHEVCLPPFIHEFFNVKPFAKTTSSKLAISRVVNALTEAINLKNATLPKYLVVVLDKDVLTDIEESYLDSQTIQRVTSWLVHQINTIVHRKQVDIFTKRPGTLSGYCTKIIFVKMIRRVGKFNDLSKFGRISGWRAKFNDALNDAAAKIDQYVLTINDYCTYEHFDRFGNLSIKGKSDFWMEIDDPIQCFDAGRVKLLPNPKNPPKTGQPQRVSQFHHDVFNKRNHPNVESVQHSRHDQYDHRFPNFTHQQPNYQIPDGGRHRTSTSVCTHHY